MARDVPAVIDKGFIAPSKPVERDRSVKLIARVFKVAADRSRIDLEGHRESFVGGRFHRFSVFSFQFSVFRRPARIDSTALILLGKTEDGGRRLDPCQRRSRGRWHGQRGQAPGPNPSAEVITQAVRAGSPSPLSSSRRAPRAGSQSPLSSATPRAMVNGFKTGGRQPGPTEQGILVRASTAMSFPHTCASPSGTHPDRK